MELVILAVQIVQVVVSILLILVVLLQPGKSGDLGSIFGGGTSESVFGAAGAVPFLAKLTRGLAVLFMISSLALGYFAAKGVTRSVVTDVSPPAVEQTTTGDTTGEENQATLPEGTEGTTEETPAQNAESAEADTAETGEGGTEGEQAPAGAQESGDALPEEGSQQTEPETQEKTQ